MSEDEIIVFALSLAIGLGGWCWWFWRAGNLERQRPGHPRISAGYAGIGASVALTIVIVTQVIKRAGSLDVRESLIYLLFYQALGLAWVRLSAELMSFVGISPRDDVIERRNRAAIPAVGGALIAISLCYAGGNVGNGPGWWVVVFCAALATGGLAAVWLVVDRLTTITDAVTIDRDPSAGLRLGGLLIACGLVLGRAVAGDWHSLELTVADFVFTAWGVIPIIIVAVGVERVARPRSERPRHAVHRTRCAARARLLVARGRVVWWRGWPAYDHGDQPVAASRAARRDRVPRTAASCDLRLSEMGSAGRRRLRHRALSARDRARRLGRGRATRRSARMRDDRG